MKCVASVPSTVSHGSTSGREGLDVLLATPALTEDFDVFLIGDGVSQILQGQQSDAVLVRDYIVTFKLLELYDIDQCWLCAVSLCERGLQQGVNFVVDATALEPEDLHRGLSSFDVILRL